MTRFLRRFLRNRRAAAMMIFAFAAVPMCFAVGMGVDYARAMKAETKLNAIADSAALLAVSKSLLPWPDDIAVLMATKMFNTQASHLLGPANVTLTSLTITAPTDASGRRTATVRYTARSGNTFSRILGMRTLTIGGTSVTSNATAPNIDFYMLLDVSGSMALPVTTAGLQKVGQSNGRGCQFACHSVNDEKGRDANGNWTDLYGVAKSYSLKLRIDEEGTALQTLADEATSTSSKNGALYRMGVWTFRGRGGFTQLSPLQPDLHKAADTAKDLKPGLYYSNGCPTSACASTEVGWNDLDTGTSDAMDNMNAKMSAPGSGLRGNAAQGIMFLITDGMRDEYRNGGRPEIAIDTAKCTAIKNRGIRIAVLYTEYLPDSLANDDWSQSNVAPYLFQVEPALQNCASAGLYTKVTTDQDIAAALDKLFQNAVATARITG